MWAQPQPAEHEQVQTMCWMKLCFIFSNEKNKIKKEKKGLASLCFYRGAF